MKKFTTQLGFTMIELLIVITILGILAVAVLAVINPIEQINRGRDTGMQGASEQLLSAVERYNAFNGFYPWQADSDDVGIGVDDAGIPMKVTDSLPAATIVDADDCPIVDRLATGSESVDGCNGSLEIKEAFSNRLKSPRGGERPLFIYNNGATGSSTYVCFFPQSNAFQEVAQQRCIDETGSGLPVDVESDARAYICDSEEGTRDHQTVMYCLP